MFQWWRHEHDSLPLVDDRVERTITTTNWNEWNSPFFPMRAAIPVFKVNINNSLPDSADVNRRKTYLNDKQAKQNELSPLYKNIHIVNKQRPSVIKRIGKEQHLERDYSEVSTVAHSSLIDVDAKHRAKSYRQEDTNQAAFCGRSVDREVAMSVINQALSSMPNSERWKRKYCCRFCSKSFQWASHWQAHERIHTGERPFKCEVCGKAFTRSDGLQCHKLTHLKKKTSSHFPWMDSKHEKDNSVQYENCKVAQKNGDTFKQQNIVRKEKKIFNCQFCTRTFLSSTGLVKHVQGHKGKKEFKCDTCNMAFSKRSALEIHSRVHSGVRPYRCNVCTKAFSIYGNLKRHLLIHTGERPYICSKCSSSFNNPSHLTRHVKNRHRTPNSNPSDQKRLVRHGTRLLTSTFKTM